MEPVRWGILSTAVIGTGRVIPAMLAAEGVTVAAVASRDPARARAVAERFGIARAHESYEALLADPDVEAIYNPLPNHLHVPWSLAALEAGKHVLCEKPIAMTAADLAPLFEARDRTGLVVEEAFMVRNHPQWLRVRELIAAGRIGELRAVHALFTYNNPDPGDIRNSLETGGGALYDLGSYTCTIARFVFDDEPARVLALMDRDPRFGTDRLTSAILDFPAGHAAFTVLTQGARQQQVTVLGTGGWIRPELPFTQAPDDFHACRIDIGGDAYPGPFPAETITLDAVNQYTLQAERFSRLVRGEPAPRWPLENAAANMRIIDALFRSGESGRFETVEPD